MGVAHNSFFETAKDASGMVVCNRDTGGAVALHRHRGYNAHSTTGKTRMRRVHVHNIAVIFARCDHARGGSAPCQPRDDDTSIRWSRVRLCPYEQRASMHMHFMVVFTPAGTHVPCIRPHSEPQRYHAVIGTRVEKTCCCLRARCE